MIIKNPNDYKFIMFKRSHLPEKKYDAVLKNKRTDTIKLVPFGDSNYQQYKDTSGLKLYSSKDNLDTKRRDLYRKRHEGELDDKFSSGYFTMRFLWT